MFSQNDGRLRFNKQNVVYKSSKTGKVDSIPAGEINLAQWRRVCLGHGIKIGTSTGHIYKYDGFRDTVSRFVVGFIIKSGLCVDNCVFLCKWSSGFTVYLRLKGRYLLNSPCLTLNLSPFFCFCKMAVLLYGREQFNNGILQTSPQWCIYKKGLCASEQTASAQLWYFLVVGLFQGKNATLYFVSWMSRFLSPKLLMGLMRKSSTSMCVP